MERWKKEIQDEMARQNVDLFGTGTITITVPVTQLTNALISMNGLIEEIRRFERNLADEKRRGRWPPSN